MTKTASISLLLVLLGACVKDGDTGDETSGSATMTATSTSGGTDGSGTGDATSDTGTGEPFACGDLECAGGEVCLTFPQEPMCTDMIEGQECPPGTTATQCGGAGLPCCCEPPPPSVYQCFAPDCAGPVDCTCLVDVCVPACVMTVMPNVFICEAPPPP